ASWPRRSWAFFRILKNSRMRASLFCFSSLWPFWASLILSLVLISSILVGLTSVAPAIQITHTENFSSVRFFRSFFCLFSIVRFCSLISFFVFLFVRFVFFSFVLIFFVCRSNYIVYFFFMYFGIWSFLTLFSSSSGNIDSNSHPRSRVVSISLFSY